MRAFLKRIFNGEKPDCRLPDQVQESLKAIHSDADEITQILHDRKLLQGALGSPKAPVT